MLELMLFYIIINEGTRMPQSRYMFALSCFQMNLLREAETALCPASEPNSEVYNPWCLFLISFLYKVIFMEL